MPLRAGVGELARPSHASPHGAQKDGLNGCRARPSIGHPTRAWIEDWTHRDAQATPLPQQSA
jgi:hypothetical protein